MKRLSLILILLFAWGSVTRAAVTPDAPEEIFTAVQGTTSPAQPITLTNTGPNPIDITGVQIIGANPGAYTITNAPAGNIPLAVGATTTFQVTFDPPGGSGDNHLPAVLQITTTDAATPVVEVGLHGLSLQGLEGGNEPGLQAVVDTLGYGIDVGGTGLIIRPNPEVIAPPPGTDEIYVELFQKAGPGPISIVSVARFSPAEELPYGYYFPDGTNTPPLNEVNVMSDSNVNPINHQTLLPLTNTNVTTFDPGTFDFGFYVESLSFGRVSYTQDALNTGDRERAARIFTMADRAGNVLPNTYLLTYEDAANGDYQDYVYVISNIEPATNNPPVANDDNASTQDTNPVVINAANNDVGVDTLLLANTVTIATPPAQGTVVNNGDGTLTFTPAAGFSGTATFTYTVQDAFGQTSNTATVAVQVTDTTQPPPQDPPPQQPPPETGSNPAVNNNTIAVAQQDISGGFSITKRADPPIATGGDAVTFTITLRNDGNTSIDTLAVEDIVPSEFEILSANSVDGRVLVNPPLVGFNMDSLAPGQTASFTIETRMRESASIVTNRACAGGSNLAATCAEVNVLGVSALPATGETPLTRILFGWGATLMLLSVAFMGLSLVLPGRRTARREDYRYMGRR